MGTCASFTSSIEVYLLGKAGHINEDREGKFHIVFSQMNHKLLQRSYLKNLLESASKRIDTDYEKPTSHFVGYTFTASDSNLVQLRMDLKTLMEKYMAEEPDQASATQIAQACFQIFPVVSI